MKDSSARNTNTHAARPAAPKPVAGMPQHQGPTGRASNGAPTPGRRTKQDSNGHAAAAGVASIEIETPETKKTTRHFQQTSEGIFYVDEDTDARILT